MPTAVCPECSEKVFVDAESDDYIQGKVVSCDECGLKLEVVGLDPLELDIYEGKDDADDYEDELDYDSLDYDDDRY